MLRIGRTHSGSDVRPGQTKKLLCNMTAIGLSVARHPLLHV